MNIDNAVTMRISLELFGTLHTARLNNDDNQLPRFRRDAFSERRIDQSVIRSSSSSRSSWSPDVPSSGFASSFSPSQVNHPRHKRDRSAGLLPALPALLPLTALFLLSFHRDESSKATRRESRERREAREVVCSSIISHCRDVALENETNTLSSLYGR